MDQTSYLVQQQFAQFGTTTICIKKDALQKKCSATTFCKKKGKVENKAMQAWDLQLYLQFNIEHYNATVVEYFIADSSNDKYNDDKDAHDKDDDDKYDDDNAG